MTIMINKKSTLIVPVGIPRAQPGPKEKKKAYHLEQKDIISALAVGVGKTCCPEQQCGTDALGAHMKKEGTQWPRVTLGNSSSCLLYGGEGSHK